MMEWHNTSRYPTPRTVSCHHREFDVAVQRLFPRSNAASFQRSTLDRRLRPGYIEESGTWKLISSQWVKLTYDRRELLHVPVFSNTSYKLITDIFYVVTAQDSTVSTPVRPSTGPSIKGSITISVVFSDRKSLSYHH